MNNGLPLEGRPRDADGDSVSQRRHERHPLQGRDFEAERGIESLGFRRERVNDSPANAIISAACSTRCPASLNNARPRP